MKKMTCFVMALALVLGLTQCKKEQTNTTTSTQGIHITLNVENNGSRHEVNPSTGVVSFEDNDIIYVGDGHTCIGTLRRTDGTFSGEISEPQGERLYFFFVGGFEENVPQSGSETFTVNISNQESKLPVVSCNSVKYSPNTTSYSCTLKNKCALVKFDLGEVSTDAAITLTGVKTELTIGFNGTVTNSTATDGSIVTYGTGATRYAVVLSDQAAVNEGIISAEGYTGTFSIPTAAYTNAFLTDATMTLTATPSVPQGIINGLFSVSATQQVYFSKGNLQYIGSASTPYWKFAEHQWDYLGNNGQGSTSQTVDRDLFGWGTSGYDHGATCYQPWSTSTTRSQYYAYGNLSYNLNQEGQNGQTDWGYNAISNGGNQENSGWRTLTKDEWQYVSDHHTKGWSTVNGKGGYVLRPYGVSTPIASSYTAEEWAAEEANGAVFLPAAGDRAGTLVRNVGSMGYYWSSSHKDSSNAFRVNFESNGLYQNNLARNLGHSVRLVRDAQ